MRSGSSGYILAFDFGLKHIGVAVGQTVTGTANPLVTLSARDGKPDSGEIVELVREWRPVNIVVGLPLNMDGSESEMSELARKFAADLASATGVDVDMADERLTSREAQGQLSGHRSDKELRRGVRERRVNLEKHTTRHRIRDSHGAAAALIAETWLSDQRR